MSGTAYHFAGCRPLLSLETFLGERVVWNLPIAAALQQRRVVEMAITARLAPGEVRLATATLVSVGQLRVDPDVAAADGRVRMVTSGPAQGHSVLTHAVPLGDFVLDAYLSSRE